MKVQLIIGLFLVASTGMTIKAMQAPANYAEITFINATGHDIDVTPNMKGVKETDRWFHQVFAISQKKICLAQRFLDTS